MCFACSGGWCRDAAERLLASDCRKLKERATITADVEYDESYMDASEEGGDEDDEAGEGAAAEGQQQQEEGRTRASATSRMTVIASSWGARSQRFGGGGVLLTERGGSVIGGRIMEPDVCRTNRRTTTAAKGERR